jgi:hypothetical protein
LIATTVFGPLFSAFALAHHSFAKFDQGTIVEMEGEITEVLWQNPHVRFTLRGGPAGDAAQVWHLETNSPGILRRLGIPSDSVAVGDSVLVAGNPTVNGALEMNVTNMLLPDDRELLLGGDRQSRFAGRTVGDAANWSVTDGDASRPELGLFRVWSSSFALAPLLFTDSAEPGFTVLDYPLTPAARQAVENFDPIAGSEQLANDCTPKGMPWIVEQPYDILFERDGDDILFKLEEFDVVRRIHMNWTGDRASQPFTIHGFSTGTWDGNTLVVETTNLNSPNFKFEIPASDQATLIERFTPTTQGDRLDYEIVVTDPVIFTEPVRMAKSWLSLPDQRFDAYNCGGPLSR